jgi:hypothetical protein
MYFIVTFEVLTTVSTEMILFWDFVLCSLVEFIVRFGGWADDGGSKHVWNVFYETRRHNAPEVVRWIV